MKSYIINGGKPLYGSIEINGSKNAALPILAATLLADGECRISNVPDLLDIKNMCELLSCLGCETERRFGIYEIFCHKLQNDVMSYETVNKLRASFLVAGPLLSRTGRVKISMPGGCQIGARPIDLHLKGFTAMGAEINRGHGYIEAKCKKLHGAKIYLDFPSVGATENLIMAASLADGITTIENAAAEPEIVNLADFINTMGGKIYGAGTDTIKIEGTDTLNGTDFTVIPDRIEAGTFAFATAATNGSIIMNNVITEHLKPVIAKLEECGITTKINESSLMIDASKGAKAADIKTMPYPGFPTDLQAPYVALMSSAEGTSMIVETIFENRFTHIPELGRMGAAIKVDGRTAVVEGAKRLTGAKVHATDLRAGAALVIAGLGAYGETIIEDIMHIERGYSNFAERLNSLNADIYIQ
ncbi:MAG: UDP-N-acetylglucosamine 1-carboxyvinyltransferase [Clostridia bacterium]|nr:UDP-N-acetylglucosamine 1-carboxyvinyltransferase [Clostridia bacterium]